MPNIITLLLLIATVSAFAGAFLRRDTYIPRCKKPSDRGPCLLKLKKYFYNSSKKRCEVFYYGGCKGNDNRFSSLTACKDACEGYGAPPRRYYIPRCEKRSDKGPCQDSKKRYFYNSSKNRCDVFYYGGCGGNDNRFSSITECQDACAGSGPPPSRYYISRCKKLSDKGPCLASKKRYFYNSSKNRCEVFYYGGCGGNDNRFRSLTACQDACGGYE